MPPSGNEGGLRTDGSFSGSAGLVGGGLGLEDSDFVGARLDLLSVRVTPLSGVAVMTDAGGRDERACGVDVRSLGYWFTS